MMKTISELEFLEIVKKYGNIYQFNPDKELVRADKPNMNDYLYSRYDVANEEPAYEDWDEPYWVVDNSQSVENKTFISLITVLTIVVPEITLLDYNKLLCLIKTSNLMSESRDGNTIYVEFYVNLGDLFDKMKALEIICEPSY